jgi:hypothetical protein
MFYFCPPGIPGHIPVNRFTIPEGFAVVMKNFKVAGIFERVFNKKIAPSDTLNESRQVLDNRIEITKIQ